jgi:hypothetical protein
MKAATATRIDSCPKCGEKIEATFKVYAEDVVIEKRGDEVLVVSATDASEFLGVDVDFYGPNDCCTEAINGHLAEHNLDPVKSIAAGLQYTF